MDTLQVKERVKQDFMAKANVVGVGVGLEGITVMVTRKLPLAALALEDVIPPIILGQFTDVIETGEIVALKERTDKWRPAPGGVSVGHYKITSGENFVYILWGESKIPEEISGIITVTDIYGISKTIDATELILGNEPVYVELS